MNELVTIPFRGSEVQAVDVDGKPHVVFRPLVESMVPATEPGEDGTEVPVIAEYWVSMRPDGHPREPYGNGGVWADEPRPGEQRRP